MMTLTLKDGALTVKQYMAGGSSRRSGGWQEEGLTLQRCLARLRPGTCVPSRNRASVPADAKTGPRISTMTQDCLEDSKPLVRVAAVPPDTAIAKCRSRLISASASHGARSPPRRRT